MKFRGEIEDEKNDEKHEKREEEHRDRDERGRVQKQEKGWPFLLQLAIIVVDWLKEV